MEYEVGLTTWSGLPAFSPEQRDYFFRRRAEMARDLREYLSAEDIRRMPIPFLCEDFITWRKNDLKTNRVNPVHLAILCGRASAKEEEEQRYDLECAREAELIPQETYDTLDFELKERKRKRLQCLRMLMKE
jgi:hypothetical protein